MRQFALRLTVGFLSLIVLGGFARAAKNSEIFPPEAAARNAITWKDGYFYINGKPTFLTSGEMHYARIPRALWRDRIWRAKQMGLNCIQMYVFWNATEGKEGHWDFSDNVDLDAWLSMIQEAGMYAVVRVGPYSCAEWENGGFPAWLTVKPEMTLRDDGPAFDAQVDAHLDQVEKIVAKHQINHGGNVLMVQLENEHPRGWGTDDQDPYLKHLVDQARANGLEIPLFLSGLNHGADPSGEEPYAVGASPWYTTEFWTGWIGKYGDMAADMLNEKIRGTWKIIAFGGAGYDFYVVHGGTNFGYSGDSLATSYDYSAPVGETGQFHNFYFPARRASWFAQSFSSLLTGSHNDPDFAKSDVPALRVTTRTNPREGSIVFIDHFLRKADNKNLPELPPDASAYKAPSSVGGDILSTHVGIDGVTLPHQGSLQVAAVEPRTILVNVPWTDNASFASVCTNVLLRHTLGGIEYWVCYGPAGDTGEINLNRKLEGTLPAQVDFTYPAGDTIKEIDLDSGDQHQAKLLVMDTGLTNKTWLAHDKLYIGPSFVLEDGGVEFPTEGGHATVYSASGKTEMTRAPVSPAALPTLSAWSWRDAAPERHPDFNTTDWTHSQGPQPMASYDSFQNRYGWYRTVLHRDSAGPVSLHFAGKSGTFAVFLNGEPSSFDHLDAKAGDNILAVLAKAGPRNKLYGFAGPIGMESARGLWGGVSTDKSATPLDVTWKEWVAPGHPGNPEDIAKPDYNDSAWQAVDPATLSQETQVPNGLSWFRGSFNVNPDQVDSIFQSSPFGKLSATFYLNGQLLNSNSQEASRLLVAGRNTFLMEVNGGRHGGSGNLGLSLWHNSALGQAVWSFNGGLNDLHETAIIGRVTNWSDFLAQSPWQTGQAALADLPIFWKTTFTYQHPAGMRETIGLLTPGLQSGHVWLNGHNLGEDPQRVPMYLPECWLKDGANDLVIFDFYGSKPNKVQLSRHEALSIVAPQ